VEQQTKGAAACPEGNSMPRESSMPRGSSMPPPQTFTLFLKVKMMMGKSYCFEAYGSNRRPSTGGA